MNDLALLAENFFLLFTESAPWLLLGLLVAGIMHEWVPLTLLQKHMGSSRVSAIGKAALIGAPLPLCSCGVIPAAVGLRRSGASKPATISFLVSTPETGVDSVSVSYALLGPLFAIVRPISAVISAIYSGLMVKWLDPELPINKQNTGSAADAATPVSACCATGQSANTSATAPSDCCDSKNASTATASSDCCGSKTTPTAPVSDSCCGSAAPKQQRVAPTLSVATRVSQVWQFATGKLLIDITVWLLIGLALAAAIQTWLPADFLTRWGDGLVAMLVMAVIGIPMYICATASTPIAVGFLSVGLSPGAVLVFLLAGPATNISTMGMIAKEMGRKTLALYLFSVISASILLGYILNLLVSRFSLQSWVALGQSAHDHHEISAVYALCSVILAALMLRNGWQYLQQRLGKPGQDSCCH
ncbi:SO_0444 family Cu/Zn efflux transporter [Alteromonas gilva]|uniref:SO_0444 family Cu/Zn efflux transporter n=1 Tax=Alteromonas gilva TaxID=2987522 RepID=A0ABT5L2I8_9ALTE|nr:SO_0444 family Cu/Zn efflux transporter [Alteromonas gilva]MDC8831250.1 SO_0444 family Cu/Zn efflux transporter [Alteromonas gilva]